jgi:hypothetical protein
MLDNIKKMLMLYQNNDSYEIRLFRTQIMYLKYECMNKINFIILLLMRKRII